MVSRARWKGFGSGYEEFLKRGKMARESQEIVALSSRRI